MALSEFTASPRASTPGGSQLGLAFRGVGVEEPELKESSASASRSAPSTIAACLGRCGVLPEWTPHAMSLLYLGRVRLHAAAHTTARCSPSPWGPVQDGWRLVFVY